MGTTSGCSPPLFAALTHLTAELFKISLCQAHILLLYFPTLLFSSRSLCYFSMHRQLCAMALACLLAHTWTPTCNAILSPTYKMLLRFNQEALVYV